MAQVSSVGSSAMEGDGAYNRNSILQARANVLSVNLLIEAVEKVELGASGSVVTIADYGSSQGQNSLAPMAAAIGALRRRAGPALPILIVHNDQSDNDFSSLLRLVCDSPASYRAEDPQVFTAAVAGSFYTRVLPPNSVTLGWCANSIHWLSKAPMVPDSFHVQHTKIAEAREEGRRIAAADWDSFLVCRAIEMRRAGRIIVAFPTASDNGDHGWDPLVQATQAILSQMTTNGFLSSAEVERMCASTYFRSRDELLQPFERDAPLDLEEFAMGQFPDPFYTAYQNTGDRDAFGRQWAAMARVTVAPSLAASLPQGVRKEFLDRYETEFVARFTADPQPVSMYFAQLVLTKR